MPVIKLTWTEKQTKEEKRQFIEDVAEIVSSAIRVPSEIVNVLICELPAENVRFPEAVFTIPGPDIQTGTRSQKKRLSGGLRKRCLRCLT